MVFPFLYELSSVARGKGMFEARWERGLERDVGARSWGSSNASVHSPSSEAAEPFPVGRRGEGMLSPRPPRGELLWDPCKGGQGRQGQGSADGERGPM